MKHKPVDRMIVTLKDIQHHYNLGLVDLDDRFFPYEDVKSAVEGLKNELKDFKDKNPSLDTWVHSEILRMIDKWFKDVIR